MKTARILLAAAAAAAGPSVLVVEDIPEYARTLARGLRASGDVVVAETVSAAMAVIRNCGSLKMAAVDHGLPDGDGLDVAVHLTLTAPRVRVVLLSGYLDPALVWRAFDVGVRALPKPMDAADIERLRRALDDDEARGAEVAKWRAAFALTGTEADNLSRLASGQQPKEIAAARGVAERTVRAQIELLRHKTGAESVADLLRAFREQLWLA
jgi:DNA-binding NarL/FixJ family response regulator